MELLRQELQQLEGAIRDLIVDNNRCHENIAKRIDSIKDCLGTHSTELALAKFKIALIGACAGGVATVMVSAFKVLIGH